MAHHTDSPTYELVQLPNGWTVGRFAALSLLGVPHMVTTRDGPDVGLIHTDPAAAAEAIAAAMGLDGVAFQRQVHESRIVAVGCSGPAGECDGLATGTAGLGLMAVSADCPLLLVADRLGGAVGIAHASWRSTVKRIAANLVDVLTERFGTPRTNLVACIAPSAGACCYEVGTDVMDKAAVGLGQRASRYFVRHDGRMFMDLWAANREQLVAAGLNPADIHASEVCTICHHDRYPSFRAEGERAGRFAAVIAVPPA